MSIFQKKSTKPKRLTIVEMWELYRLLGKGLGKHYLLDEVVEMMKSVPPVNIKVSLKIMYDSVSISNPLEVGLLFVRGLKYNKFFEFQEFVETLNGSTQPRIS